MPIKAKMNHYNRIRTCNIKPTINDWEEYEVRANISAGQTQHFGKLLGTIDELDIYNSCEPDHPHPEHT